MDIAAFLLYAIGISLSGVMAPGAVTAATIAHGARRRDAGVLIAVGHGIIEFPLMFAIIAGFGVVIESTAAQILIGMAGGVFLLWMGVGMLRHIAKGDLSPEATITSGPVLTGFALSVSNPYFLLWWATIGLKLATDARQLGWMAFVLFTVIHWLCDLVWLGFLGAMSFGGSRILGGRMQQIILRVCGTALVLFSIRFIYSAAVLWLEQVRPA